MKTANIAIWILSVLDVALLAFIPLLDKRMYRRVRKPASLYFFWNAMYDEPVNRFMLSKCGVLLLVIGCTGMLLLATFLLITWLWI
ncbi:hypothetical protein [Pedobacter sp. KBW06]|uniref:hypothetical protein n=1 Tax=Pedobacter sp. KBW06 TaxID=2153359 RepID=UPI000F59775C|nr:hypothetical protein [Pedobacter sp. KBW06]